MMRMHISDITSVSLAGGGNRCWWQAGVLEVWQHSGRLAAKRFAGTSAGAGVAAAALCGNLMQAIEACRAAYASNPSLWLGKRHAWFAQEEIYPAWVSSFVTDAGLARMRASNSELMVGICRLPRFLPNWVGIGFGMAAYLIDKYGASSLHPRLAARLGLKLELHAVHEAPDTKQAAHLLVCAAAAPPFIATRWLQERPAVDGGFADNAPRLPLSKQDDRQLILLTRHYAKLPLSFYFEGRNYLQPSRKIPVSTWDCTASADIMAAVELGRKDGLAALSGFTTSKLAERAA
jgi:predicted acylesterase/phospholipase RssA